MAMLAQRGLVSAPPGGQIQRICSGEDCSTIFVPPLQSSKEFCPNSVVPPWGGTAEGSLLAASLELDDTINGAYCVYHDGY